jgi:hypothetical protein
MLRPHQPQRGQRRPPLVRTGDCPQRGQGRFRLIHAVRHARHRASIGSPRRWWRRHAAPVPHGLTFRHRRVLGRSSPTPGISSSSVISAMSPTLILITGPAALSPGGPGICYGLKLARLARSLSVSPAQGSAGRPVRNGNGEPPRLTASKKTETCRNRRAYRPRSRVLLALFALLARTIAGPRGRRDLPMKIGVSGPASSLTSPPPPAYGAAWGVVAGQSTERGCPGRGSRRRWAADSRQKILSPRAWRTG